MFFVNTGKSSVPLHSEEKRTITIAIPRKCEGKGKHSAQRSFEDAFKKMINFKMRSILIPIRTEGSWPTTKFVKNLLYPLMQLSLQEVITVILYSSDYSQCKAANDVIRTAMNDADTCRKGRDLFRG